MPGLACRGGLWMCNLQFQKESPASLRSSKCCDELMVSHSLHMGEPSESGTYLSWYFSSHNRALVTVWLAVQVECLLMCPLRIIESPGLKGTSQDHLVQLPSLTSSLQPCNQRNYFSKAPPFYCFQINTLVPVWEALG